MSVKVWRYLHVLKEDQSYKEQLVNYSNVAKEKAHLKQKSIIADLHENWKRLPEEEIYNEISNGQENFIGIRSRRRIVHTWLESNTIDCTLTFTYSVVFIGEERVDRAIRWYSKYMILRYSLMLILAVLMINP